MIEGNLSDLTDEERQDIVDAAEAMQADFDSYRDAKDYFTTLMIESRRASFEAPY